MAVCPAQACVRLRNLPATRAWTSEPRGQRAVRNAGLQQELGEASSSVLATGELVKSGPGYLGLSALRPRLQWQTPHVPQTSLQWGPDRTTLCKRHCYRAAWRDQGVDRILILTSQRGH